jgi:hypothetical protein
MRTHNCPVRNTPRLAAVGSGVKLPIFPSEKCMSVPTLEREESYLGIAERGNVGVQSVVSYSVAIYCPIPLTYLLTRQTSLSALPWPQP